MNCIIYMKYIWYIYYSYYLYGIAYKADDTLVLDRVCHMYPWDERRERPKEEVEEAVPQAMAKNGNYCIY